VLSLAIFLFDTVASLPFDIRPNNQQVLGSQRQASIKTQPMEPLLGEYGSSRKPPAPSPIPGTDSIHCPSSNAIMPIYGPPSQHHSYITAVNTFCRRDLSNLPSARPGDLVTKSTHYPSGPFNTTIAPGEMIRRSYSISSVTANGNIDRYDLREHQINLEIENKASEPTAVSTEECMNAFTLIVEASGGCRVSDALTKAGEYRVGTGSRLSGFVFKAEESG
jgi:hypothetical protein